MSLNIRDYKISDVERLLNNSSVKVGVLGAPYLVARGKAYIEMEVVGKKIKDLSIQMDSLEKPMNTAKNRKSGINCLKKMREFYQISDKSFFAKIRNVFDNTIEGVCVSIHLLDMLFFRDRPSWCPYSIRSCIEIPGNYAYAIGGPDNIEDNFSWVR